MKGTDKPLFAQENVLAMFKNESGQSYATFLCQILISFSTSLKLQIFPYLTPPKVVLTFTIYPQPQVFDRNIQLPYDDFEFRGLNLENKVGHKRSEKVFLMDPKSYN